MKNYEEDYTSARRFSVDNFDCELPPDARTELRRPRRSPILGRPPAPPTPGPASRVPLYAALLVAGLLAGGALVSQINRKPEAPVAKDVVLEHSKAAVEAQTPAIGWHSDGTAYGRAGVIGQRTAPAPRATLVRLPAPRAELVSIPVGGSLWITMPYSERVWITYTGHVPSFETLPRSGNFMGETRVAADTNIAWVWTVPPGGVAQWVDP